LSLFDFINALGLGVIVAVLAGRNTPAMIVFGLLGSSGYFLYADDAFVRPRTDETVRQLFHLPDDVALKRNTNKQGIPCYGQSSSAKRSVQFTPEQFANYVALTEDRSRWRPVVPPHYVPEKSHVHFSDDALKWQSIPEPRWIGEQQMVWDIAGMQLRRGLAQCYEFNKVATPDQAPGKDGRVTYAVTACNPLEHPGIPKGGALVTAALDADTQRLSVLLQFRSKPDYCKNRVSKWLSATFGPRLKAE
jgi:hypothetical protein